MSIPIDKLYKYIESIAQNICGCGDIVIYRFFPHGSKKLEDLTPLNNYRPFKMHLSLSIYCNDQEPLNYQFYQDDKLSRAPLRVKNLRLYDSIYDKVILLHSEKNSINVIKYQNNNFVPVYYWSHGIIALDWYRYAFYENLNKNINKTFLIYNRAWSATREYRLKFIDLLIENNLINKCHTTLNPIEPELGIHYNSYNFVNSNFIPTRQLENHLPLNTADSTASADYEISDYNSTEFEIVLETLFDDSRLHLTEKVLRPIALGQPFLLAATAGSLEYLRSYGFKTFATVIDESYDTIEDPVIRLEAIVAAMAKISNWTAAERIEKMAIVNRIAEYNRKHFFSNKFFNQLIDELTSNLKDGIDIIKNTNTSNVYIKTILKSSNYRKTVAPILKADGHGDLKTIVKKAKEYYRRTLPKD